MKGVDRGEVYLGEEPIDDLTAQSGMLVRRQRSPAFDIFLSKLSLVHALSLVAQGPVENLLRVVDGVNAFVLGE